MSKSDRRKKIARKRASKPLPELAPIKAKPHAGGRDKRTTSSNRVADPQKIALEARCNRSGREATRQNLRAARDPLLDCEAGIALSLSHIPRDEKVELWNVLKECRAAMMMYHRRILQRSPIEQNANITVLPEYFGTDASDRPDLRSEEEKDNAAVSAFMAWHGRVGHLSGYGRDIFWDAVWDRSPNLIKDGKITRKGRAAIVSMQVVRDSV